jgi:hypothetical protein
MRCEHGRDDYRTCPHCMGIGSASKKSFEMAHSDDPEEIALAVQRALIASMRDVLSDVRKTMSQPGLTWEQLDYFLMEYGKKKPIIIVATTGEGGGQPN